MGIHKEIRALTGLRGVAALYVVAFHSVGALASTNPFNILLNHGYLAVDVFFVLSGLVMALNYRHLFNDAPIWPAYRLFLGRRIARLYPLYLCGTLIGYLISHNIPWNSPGLAALNLTMTQAWVLAPSFDAPGWSLSAEWAAYLIFPALLSLLFFKPSRRHWLGLIVCVASVGVFARLPQLIHQPPFSFSNDFFYIAYNQVLRCLPEFALGILVIRGLGTPLERSLQRTFVAHPWVVTLANLGILALLFFRGTEFLFVLLLPLALLSLLQAGNPPARLLSSAPVYFFGRISYSLYIIHSLFRPVSKSIHAWAALHRLPHPQAWAASLCFVFAVFVSRLAHQYIEQPASKRLRAAFEGPSPCLSPKIPVDS